MMLTATLTATAIVDTSGPRWTRVPVTSIDGTGVHHGPSVPVTTDQKAGGSSPSERASLTSGNASGRASLSPLRRLRDSNRDSNPSRKEVQGMEPCAAAIPLRQRNLTGRMVGGDPVITHEHVTDYWAECGEPSVAVYEYRCEHGHVVRKPTCAEHEPDPVSVGCRQCYDQGHECGMQILPLYP